MRSFVVLALLVPLILAIGCGGENEPEPAGVTETTPPPPPLKRLLLPESVDGECGWNSDVLIIDDEALKRFVIGANNAAKQVREDDRHPRIRVEVVVGTSDDGTAEANQRIFDRRSAAAGKLLWEHGLDFKSVWVIHQPGLSLGDEYRKVVLQVVHSEQGSSGAKKLTP